MPKRERTPKTRVPPISAEALRLFQRGRAIQKLGRAERPESGPTHRLTKEYYQIENDLRRAFDLEFSDFNPLRCPDKQPVQNTHLCIVQSWPKIHRIRVALEAADRESRRRLPQTAADAPDGDAGGPRRLTPKRAPARLLRACGRQRDGSACTALALATARSCCGLKSITPG